MSTVHPMSKEKPKVICCLKKILWVLWNLTVQWKYCQSFLPQSVEIVLGEGSKKKKIAQAASSWRTIKAGKLILTAIAL